MTTNERTQLTQLGNNISPTWSPDGTQIAFLSDRNGRWDIWVMNADGTQQRPMFAAGMLANITFEFHFSDYQSLVITGKNIYFPDVIVNRYVITYFFNQGFDAKCFQHLFCIF